MNAFKSFLFSLIMLVPAISASPNPKSTIIVMDMDDVMSIKQKPGAMDFIGLSRIVLQHPWVLTALANIGALQQEGNEIGKQVNGAGNTVHAMLEKLKEQGYGDFSDYEYEILERATKPKPIQAMIEAMKELKRQGYILIGATNHDWKQELAYRAKMRKQGVDPNELFDAVLVTRVNNVPTIKGEKASSFYKPVVDENMYSATLQRAYKPLNTYFAALKKLVHHIAQQKGVSADKIIFTDDKLENVDAAKAMGIEAIHFDLPGGSARKTSPEDLQKTIKNWKTQLGKHGVSIQ